MNIAMKYNHKVTSEIYRDVPVIYIEGDMTSDADSDVKKVYADVMENQDSAKLIINFEKTKYINSSGIATLINLIQSINEKSGKIAFVALSDHFHKVMDIVGITDFVKIYDANDSAIQAMEV